MLFHRGGGYLSSGEGTDLGLAISQKLVEMMGGELHVKSTVGEGSIFWFDLNLPEVKGFIPQDTSYRRKIIGYKGERHTVLVVDDEQGNRAVLVGMLLPLGFKILEAENGQECVEKAIRYTPDLILLDLRMPVLDGFGVTQRIREHESRIPIIAISAAVFEETRKRALAIGFNDFLIKPFQLEDLLDLLHTHLSLEWIYEEKAKKSPEVVSHRYSEPQSISLSPKDLEILLELASKSRIKSLLEHLARLEAVDENAHPFIEELRQLAKGYQAKEIVKRLQQIERKFRQVKQD